MPKHLLTLNYMQNAFYMFTLFVFITQKTGFETFHICHTLGTVVFFL